MDVAQRRGTQMRDTLRQGDFESVSLFVVRNRRQKLPSRGSLCCRLNFCTAMGAHESKPGAVTVSDQEKLLKQNHRTLLICGKKRKSNQAKETRGSSCFGGWVVDASSFLHQRPPPLARLSIDESSSSTNTHNEDYSVPANLNHHLIELSTLSRRSGATGDDLQVSHDFATKAVKSYQGFDSDSSAFSCYTSPRRRRRAFAAAGGSWGRTRVAEERTDGFSCLPQEDRTTASHISPPLLARRMWLLTEADGIEKQGNLTGARSYLEECSRMDQNVIVNPLAAAYVCQKLGVLNWKVGDYHASTRVLLEGLKLYDIYMKHPHEMQDCVAGAPLDEIRGLAVMLITLGRVHISLGEVDAAFEYITKGVDALKRSIRSHHGAVDVLQPYYAQALVCLGIVYDVHGRSSRAMNIFQKSLQIQRTCLGISHVDVAATLNRIGGIHETRGAHDEAIVYYTEALRIYRSQLGLGCSPLDVAVTLNKTGFMYHKWSQYDRAIGAYREALAIFNLLLGPCHRNITATKYNIAQAFVARGSAIRGLRLLKQVFRDQQNLLCDDHPDVAVTLEAIATANEHLGRLSKACSYHEKALSIRVHRFGSKHMLVARSQDQLGQLHSQCGRRDLARHCFREALIVYRHNVLADSDWRIVFAEKKLAQLDRMTYGQPSNRIFNGADTFAETKHKFEEEGDIESNVFEEDQSKANDKARLIL